MGAGKQIRRALLDMLDSFKSIFKRKEKYDRKKSRKTVKVPSSWKSEKKSSRSRKKNEDDVEIIEQKKIRIPGFRTIKRLIAAVLLLLNFIFSQFLLGSIGQGAQPMFILFLGNAFIIGDYLWKTRNKRTE